LDRSRDDEGGDTDDHSGMRVGLFTDGLAHLERREAFAWCAERGILDVELGVGSWSPRPHVDLDTVLSEKGARDELVEDLAEHGLQLAAINAAGNPLHPDLRQRRRAQDALRGAIELAALLGVDRVITMSGCPGARLGSGVGIFGIWSLSCDDEGLYDWQLEERVGPFWTEASNWAARVAPDLRICLELHPGVTVFGVDGFRRLKTFVGGNIGVNLDPSHFFWQGIDPTAVIAELGDAIGFAHGKDTTIYPDRMRLHGLLDPRFPVDPRTASWHFSAVGRGHDQATWTAFVAALRTAGYDGVISVEHEDPSLPPEQCIEESAATLRAAIAAEVTAA
jgi:sugar phosphate isomerase/epimerase